MLGLLGQLLDKHPVVKDKPKRDRWDRVRDRLRSRLRKGGHANRPTAPECRL